MVSCLSSFLENKHANYLANCLYHSPISLMKMSSAQLIVSWFFNDKQAKRIWLEEIINTPELDTIFTMSKSIIDKFFKLFVDEYDTSSKNHPFPHLPVANLQNVPIALFGKAADLYQDKKV
jgi:hypothetical protein